MGPVAFLDGRVTLYPGDMREVLASLPENSVDSVVCDPPYHLTSIVKRFGGDGAAEAKEGATGAFKCASAGFMGKQWDGGDIAFQPDTWRAVMRVLKPGGYLLAFSATRSYHRMGVAIEDAGFEIRDQIGWCYASGFPKSLNVSKKLNGIRCSCARPERPDPVLQHNLRCVQSADVSEAELVCEEREEVLFEGMSEHGLHDAVLRAEPEEGCQGREEQVLEGRRHTPQEAGKLRLGKVCQMPGSPAINGADGRLRDGASEGDGGVDRSPAAAGGVRPSRGSQAAEQCPPQSGTLAGQSQPQDGGAWPHCGRCGKPIVPDGLGTALKPAWEPICVARKPLIGTVAENILAYGTGAVNVDGCRIAGEQWQAHRATGLGSVKFFSEGETPVIDKEPHSLGRWPANLIHDGSEDVLQAFPETKSGYSDGTKAGVQQAVFGKYGAGKFAETYGDEGSAARFFYTAKADAYDRITRNVEEVEIEWISESGQRRVKLQADTELSLEKAIVVSPSTDANGWNTFLCGSIITEIFRKATKCIISTGTSSTTKSRIWSLLTHSLTSACIADVSYETANGGSLAESAENGPRSITITLGETVSLPGASRALSKTQLRISVSARRHSHPTCKPLELIQYLCRLVTPPGGTVLDCFAGTGTTGEAAWREGFKAILIEREAEYQADIARRMDLAVKPTKRAAVAKSKGKLLGAEGTPLFSETAA